MDSKIPLLRSSTEVLVASVIVCSRFRIFARNKRPITDATLMSMEQRYQYAIFQAASRMVLERGKRDPPFTN